MTTSTLDIISLDVLELERIARENPMRGIESALKSVSLNTLSEKDRALPSSLRALLTWRKWEKRVCSKAVASLVINFIYAPMLFMGFAVYSGQVIWYFIFVLSIPFAALGIFSLWARKINWFAGKITLLRDDPFVVLVDNRLIENIPEKSALLADAELLKTNVRESEERALKLDALIIQIKQAASELADADPSRSIQRLEREKKEQKELRNRARKIIHDIEAAIIIIDKNRSEIHSRARLEMLRNQAEQATLDERKAFSRDSVESLTVDRVDFQYRLASLQTDMADAAIRWKTENDINA